MNQAYEGIRYDDGFLSGPSCPHHWWWICHQRQLAKLLNKCLNEAQLSYPMYVFYYFANPSHIFWNEWNFTCIYIANSHSYIYVYIYYSANISLVTFPFNFLDGCNSCTWICRYRKQGPIVQQTILHQIIIELPHTSYECVMKLTRKFKKHYLTCNLEKTPSM